MKVLVTGGSGYIGSHTCVQLLLQGLAPLNRQLVRRFVDVLIGEGATPRLFVSHHAEDAPDCITHRLAFVPSGDGYTYQLGPVA